MTSPHTLPSVLVITRNLPPLVGGMERLLLEAVTILSRSARVHVIGPRDCGAHLPDGVVASECPNGAAGFLMAALTHARRLCAQQPVDLVIGGSALVLPVLAAAKHRGARKSACFVHGLDLVYDSVVYQRLFLRFLGRLDRVIANSGNTARLAVERGADVGSTAVIPPGVTLQPPPSPTEVDTFLEKQSVPFSRYLLFSGRMTARKGLSRFVTTCLDPLLTAHPDLGLLIVGNEAMDSLNKSGEAALVKNAIAACAHRERVRLLGEVSDEQLRYAMAGAAVQIMPAVPIKGDVEGFGMVIVEAAAMGTPTVAFDEGGIADAIGKGCGRLVPGQDYAAFSAAVEDSLVQDACTKSCRAHAATHAWEHYGERLMATLAPLLTEPAIHEGPEA